MDDEMIETTRMGDTAGPETYDGPKPYDEPAPAVEARSFENGEESPEHSLERVVDEPDQPEVSNEPGGPYEPGEPDVSGESDSLDESDGPDETDVTEARDEPEEEEHGEPSPDFSQPPAAPIMELDDMNFLEIPVAGVPVLPPVYEEAPEPVDDTNASPEFVETVVQRVVEKLCGDSLQDVIREAVREVYAERSGD
jgi:hypothetical protein